MRDSVGAVVDALAEANEAMIGFAVEIRSVSGVRDLQNHFDMRRMPYNGVLSSIASMYVDAELHNGRSVCWMVELVVQELSWVLTGEVVTNGPDGEDTLEEFPETNGTTVVELSTNLKNLVAAMTRTGGWASYVPDAATSDTHA